MSPPGEIVSIDTSSQQAFIDEAGAAISRSETKAVFGYRSREEAELSLQKSPNYVDGSIVMIIETLGMLAIDDMLAPVTRGGGKTSSPLYELDRPNRWPPDLWGRLVTYTWVIDHPINPLDVIARKV